MNERELGKAMVEQSRGNDQAIAERLVRRDRRLVRGLTALTVGFWALAAGAILTLYWMLIVFIMPTLEQLAAQPQEAVDARSVWSRLWHFGMHIGWPMTIAGTTLVILAAICTVLLVHSSRRATLRLVDHRLEMILAELRRQESRGQTK